VIGYDETKARTTGLRLMPKGRGQDLDRKQLFKAEANIEAKSTTIKGKVTL